MKFLAVTSLLLAAAPMSPAAAAVFSVGGALSSSCYEAALVADAQSYNLDACSRSLKEEALEIRDRAATHVNRGILFMASGRLADADADFDQALKFDPALADGWLNKGFLRLRQGQGRAALPLIQKAIDIGLRRPALALFARGVAYEQMGEFRSAYADLNRAHELEPNWSLPRQYLATYRVQNR